MSTKIPETTRRRGRGGRRWWRWGCGTVAALLALLLVLAAVWLWRANDTLEKNITVDDQLLPSTTTPSTPPDSGGDGGTESPTGDGKGSGTDGGGTEKASPYLKDVTGDGKPDKGAKGTVTAPSDSAEKAQNPSRGAEGTRNILIVGEDDGRSNGAVRSDVMILAHMNASGSKVTLVHFPRDLWVPIPGHGFEKLNYAYSAGGAPLLAQTFQGALDVPVTDVAVTDFESFSSTVDALGGVTVRNPQPSPEFPEGTVRLDDGAEALRFVRERKTLKLGDMGRGERQMAVLSGVFDAARSAEVARNPNKVQRILDASTRNVRVSAGLSPKEIRGMGRRFITGGGTVTYQTAPWASIGWSPDGRQSIVVPDWAGIRALGEKVRNDSL